MEKIETLLNLLEEEFQEQGSNSVQAKFLKNLSEGCLKYKDDKRSKNDKNVTENMKYRI